MSDHDELQPSETEGYKKPKEATLEEMKKLDQDDEALNKWKESLLKGGDAVKSDDPRRVVILKMCLEVQGRDDLVLELDTPEKVEANKKSVWTLKEGVDYRIKVTFRVQNEIVTGLKYLHVVKRMGVKVDKSEEMIGSYAPSSDPHEKKFPMEQAPSGMMARAKYDVKSRFQDDDGNTFLEWAWAFEIKKDWD